jgi:DNA polymerase-4
MLTSPRSILHIDMDAFFASIEQLDRPELRGKPVLVGHDGPRGVVSTASYEARPFGCRSAQPMAVAKRLCPQAIVVAVRFDRYRQVSDQLFKLLDEFSPVVEPISIDEAFLDLTGSERALGSAEHVARAIKARIRKELEITASVGLAPNKFLAKLASDLQKPDGLTIITAENRDQVLPPLPVTRIWGIGPKTADRLQQINLRTIGDLRRMPEDWFDSTFGEDGGRLRRLAFGLDDRAVTPDSQAKSISQEQTFGTDVIHAEELRGILLDQVEHVAARLRRSGCVAGSIRLKIRDGTFKTITRSRVLDPATDATTSLWKNALEIFDEWARDSLRPVRLLGFAADKLSGVDPQFSLFPDAQAQKSRHLDSTLDRINTRFGPSAIRRAGH